MRTCEPGDQVRQRYRAKGLTGRGIVRRVTFPARICEVALGIGRHILTSRNDHCKARTTRRITIGRIV